MRQLQKKVVCFSRLLKCLQGSQSPDFGAEIRPHSQCQKVFFFSQFQTKNSQFEKKKIFFFFFSSLSLFHIIQIQSILYLLYIKKKSKFNYWNQSSNGNVIHKDDVKFPNFSQNAAYFPNSMGPGPIPKKGCESPGLRSLFGKQCGPRSDCSYWSSLFWVHAVCFYT